MDDHITEAAEYIARAKYVIALTGAGISVESGIPPFRGKGGLWEKFDPMEFAHIDSFLKDPAKVWNVLFKEMKEMLHTARPNDAHKGLARLETLGRMKTVITQNVDGFHQISGNTDVIEFHGSIAWNRCLKCNGRIKSSETDMTRIPPRCQCGGIYKPDCIFFGEMIPPEHLYRSRQVASKCDIMIVIGTSAVVQPAASMPVIAKDSGAKIIEINPDRTPLTQSISDCFIQGQAGKAMNMLVSEVERLL